MFGNHWSIGSGRTSETLPDWKPSWTFEEPGQIITALVAKVQHSSSSFHGIGCRSAVFADAPCHGPSLPSLTPQSGHHDLAEMEPEPEPENTFPISKSIIEVAMYISERRGLCFTTAYLSRIKRIRVSGGLPGRSRTASHVSGLSLEFWNSKNLVIIGQWMDDLDVKFEFAQGEAITAITTWQTQQTPPRFTGRANNGRITGIRLHTSRGSTHEVLLGGEDANMLSLHYSANPWEELVCSSYLHVCGCGIPPRSANVSVFRTELSGVSIISTTAFRFSAGPGRDSALWAS